MDSLVTFCVLCVPVYFLYIEILLTSAICMLGVSTTLVTCGFILPLIIYFFLAYLLKEKNLYATSD